MRYLDSRVIAEVVLPLYYPNKKKPLLLGWNQVMNLHPYTKNTMKRWYDNFVLSQLSKESYDLYDGKFSVSYQLYYPHARIDLGNVGGVADKFFCDAIQNAGLVKSDNVNNCIGISFLVAGRDAENPRIVAKIWKEFS